MKIKLILLLTFSLLLTACAGSTLQADADAVSTIVAATILASNNQPSATPLPITSINGTIEGSICYPSEGIPPLNLYLHQTSIAEPIQVPHTENQSTFSAQVPAGVYTAYAWTQDFGIGGSYSAAVACGLSVECTDHSLVQFQVTAGATTTGVQVCDWYGNPGDVPLPPGVVVQQGPGAITGSLSYPSEMIPAMQVVAFTTDFSTWYYVQTNQGDSTYQINDLPPDDYFVVAYIAGDDYGGGYSYAVPCGLSVSCTDHNLIPVTVLADQLVVGVDPGDWYAPQGTYPANPLP